MIAKDRRWIKVAKVVASFIFVCGSLSLLAFFSSGIVFAMSDRSPTRFVWELTTLSAAIIGSLYDAKLYYRSQFESKSRERPKAS